MGVHGLWKLIESAGKPVPVETLDNKVLAVDVSIWLHQLMKGYQTPAGGSVSNAYLIGLFTRVCKLLFTNVKPVFVFDGGVPQLKKKTIAARQQQKSKSAQAAEKVREQLLKNLLKQKAVGQVLEEIRGTASPKKQAPDMFELPPLPENESESEVEEMSDSESEEDVKPVRMKYRDLHSVDVKSAEFKSLPADMRHDILTELKETRKQNSWGRLHEMPEESGDFSQFQMARLLKRRSVQVSLEEAEKEMGGRTLNLQDVEALLAEGGVEINPQLSKRIASDNVTRFIYVTGTGDLSKTSQNSSDDSKVKIEQANFNYSQTETSVKIKQEGIEIESDDSFDVELVKEVEAIEMAYCKIKQEVEDEDEFKPIVNDEFAVEGAFENDSDSEGVIIDDLDLIKDNSGLSQDQILAIIKKENENKKANAMFEDSAVFPSSSGGIEIAQSENESSEEEPIPEPSPSKSQITDITQNAENTQSKILDSVYFKIYENKMQSALSKKSRGKNSLKGQTTSHPNKKNDKGSNINLSALASSSAESDSEHYSLPCSVFELEQPKQIFTGISKKVSFKLGAKSERNVNNLDVEATQVKSKNHNKDFENELCSKSDKNKLNEKSLFPDDLNLSSEILSQISKLEESSVNKNESNEDLSKEQLAPHGKKDNLNTIEVKLKRNYTSKPKRVAHQPKNVVDNTGSTRPPAQTPKKQVKEVSLDDIFDKIFSEDSNVNESITEPDNVVKENLNLPVNKPTTTSITNVPNIKNSASPLKPSLKKPTESFKLDHKPRSKPKNIGNLIKEINTKSCKINEKVATNVNDSTTSGVEDIIPSNKHSSKNKNGKSYLDPIENLDISKLNQSTSSKMLKRINQEETNLFSANQVSSIIKNPNNSLQIQLKPTNVEIEDDIFADVFLDDKNNFEAVNKISHLIQEKTKNSDDYKKEALFKAKKVLFEEEPLKVSFNKLNEYKSLEKQKYSVPNEKVPSNSSSHLPLNQINVVDKISPDKNVEIMSDSDNSEDVDDPLENNIENTSPKNFQITINPIKNEMEVDIFADVFSSSSTISKRSINDKHVFTKIVAEQKTNVDDKKTEDKESSSEGLQITIKAIENEMEEDIFADVFTTIPKEREMPLEEKDLLQKFNLEVKNNTGNEANKEIVDERKDSSKSKIMKEASNTTSMASLSTSSFESPSFNSENSIASTSEEMNSPSTSETPTAKPKRTLNMKQLEKLQDILETKERELVIDHNREDRLATSITDQMYQEAQELLRLFGVPYVVAPMEAEAQCAFLDAAGLTQGTITDDSDIWLFGGRKVYKNFFDQKKFVLEFQAENIQQYFKLSRSHLVLLALLVGSDYTVGLTGVGPVTALEILATFPVTSPDSRDPGQLLVSLHRFKQWWQSQPQSYTSLAKKLKNLDLHEGFPSSAVVSAYLQPRVDESREPFSWGAPDLPALRDFAERRFGWNRERVDQLLLPAVNRLNKKTSQLTLHTFFGAVPNIPAHREQMSRRVQTAVNRLEGGREDFEPLQPRPRQPRGRGRGRGVVRGGGGAPPTGRGRGTGGDDNDEDLSIDKPPEVIPQREKDKMEAMKRKQQAIEVLKNKKPRGMKKRRNVRQIKAQADLSESSSDD